MDTTFIAPKGPSDGDAAAGDALCAAIRERCSALDEADIEVPLEMSGHMVPTIGNFVHGILFSRSAACGSHAAPGDCCAASRSRTLSLSHPSCRSPLSGKLVHHVAMNAYSRFVLRWERGGGDGSCTTRVGKVGRQQLKWSSLSGCEGPENDAWGCLFGQASSDVACARGLQGSEPAPLATLLAQAMVSQEPEALKSSADPTLAGAWARVMVPKPFCKAQRRTVVNAPSPSRHSLSVHARYGDACELMMAEKRPPSGVFWTDEATHGRRPCFQPGVYIREIERMAAVLNTTTVNVATDSEEFLSALLNDTRYNYVFYDGWGAGRQQLAFGRGFIGALALAAPAQSGPQAPKPRPGRRRRRAETRGDLDDLDVRRDDEYKHPTTAERR